MDSAGHDNSENSVVDALYKISRIVNNTDDPRDALESIIDQIIQVLPAQTAAIELINPDTQTLEVEVSRGFSSNPKDVALPLGQGITGWVAMHGKSLNVGDVINDPRYVEIDTRIRSEMAVPMHGEDGGILGVVNVDSINVNAFNERHLKILTLLTADATRVLNRIWLIRQLREKADHLEALIKTGQLVVAKRDLDEILHTITQEAREIMDCRICAIFLYDAASGMLDLKACSGSASTEDYREELALEESAIGTAIRRNKSIEILDLPKTEEHHFLPLIREHGLVSMLSCPIRYDDAVIGVLNIYTDYLHRFNNEEKRLFQTLASLGAIAIQNARLYQRIFQSEENLRKSERFTTLGLLSAEIAHEIRNPLTVIRLLFDGLSLDFEEQDPRNKDVRIINEKLDQLEGIVSRVLNFGKSREDLRARYDLNKIIDDTLYLVRLKLKQNKVEVDFSGFDEDAPLLAEVHKGQIQQALLNLIINATQAMPNGGKIGIDARKNFCDNRPWAVIRVSDTGEGIPREFYDQIFDSFLTSRPEGTGLGLAIVKRILRSHNGDIEVEESNQNGTVMKLWIPAID